ncbi:MAG TPA: Hsp20 family protein [Gallionella sp.]|nr:Hsp20 family protein [Gallionella sp.]
MANLIRRDPFFNLTRFDPFRDEDWFKGFGLRPFLGETEVTPQIKIDLTENDKAYTVRAEIPGVRKEDIKVNVEGHRVTISAEVKEEKEQKDGERVICSERYHGTSYRSFSLDDEVDETKAEAKYDNGVLNLMLPKRNGHAAKQLQIK